MSQADSKRDFTYAIEYSLLRSGGITLSEFNKIHMALEAVFLGRCPATACRRVAEFFEAYGRKGEQPCL